MLTNQKGISIVEILITIGLAAILFPALLTGFVAARGGRTQQDQRIQATAFLQETQEAIRSVREKDWTTFAALSNPPNQIFHPSLSGSSWFLVSGSETVNDLTRQVTIEDVFRDSSGLIVPSGSPGSQLDPSTKKAVATVSWGKPLPTTINSTEYLTRYFGNAAQTETQTVQAPAGFGDWCKPQLTPTNVDLDRQGHPTSIRAFESTNGTGNRVLAGTGANSSGPAFSNIQVTGNSPPSATNLGDYNGSPQVKVNGVFGDTQYAFLATDNRGIEILDLNTTPPYQKIGSFKPSNKKFNDVYVVGNTGYAVSEDMFYIFSISSDRISTSQIGSLSLVNGVRVVVDSNNQYAYVANPDSDGELKLIDVHTHPTNLTASDIRNVNVDSGSGRDVFINAASSRAYLATAASASKPEFFIINISDKANPVVIPGGTYDTDGMDPQGVVIVSGNRAIIAGLGGHEYQVFIVENDTISFCPNHDQNTDFLDIDSGVYSVSSVLQSDGHAYSYIATGDSSAELIIIEGGSGAGGGGGGTGTFESNTFDAGHDVAFNYFSATTDPNLTYKLSIKHGTSGNCSSVTFSDSDFTTFSPGALPLTDMGSGYVNPGQCLRYRAINSGSSDITFTVSFNYSP